jgi:hypothetical protein
VCEKSALAGKRTDSYSYHTTMPLRNVQALPEGSNLRIGGVLVDHGAPFKAPSQAESWAFALKVSELPHVDEALRGFSEDATEDAAVILVREILEGAANLRKALLYEYQSGTVSVDGGEPVAAPLADTFFLREVNEHCTEIVHRAEGRTVVWTTPDSAKAIGDRLNKAFAAPDRRSGKTLDRRSK